MDIGELSELASILSAIEDWLRDECTARHSEDMADAVHKAWSIVEDLLDDAHEAMRKP